MLDWLVQNIATILISAGLVAVVVLIIRQRIKSRKAGKSSCGCGCSSCPMSGSCHKS